MEIVVIGGRWRGGIWGELEALQWQKIGEKVGALELNLAEEEDEERVVGEEDTAPESERERERARERERSSCRERRGWSDGEDEISRDRTGEFA